MQIYQLQTENDEEETWRDLVRALLSFRGLRFERVMLRQSNHGFDRTLTLVSTRREDDLDQHPASEPKPIIPSAKSCTHRILLGCRLLADQVSL